MREYEFRGQALSNGQWVYGSLLIDNDRYYIGNYTNKILYGNKVAISERDRSNGKTTNRYKMFGLVEVDPETVGQYTGLKDRNGTKIYEGDIVKIDEDVRKIFDIKTSIGVVTYFSGTFYIKVSNDFANIARTSLYCIQDIYYILRGEVIGNIVENKELLEE